MVLSESRGILETLGDSLTRKEHVSKVLHDAKLDRVYFDPKNPDHIKAYAIFRNEGRWIMKFHAEGQYATIPVPQKSSPTDLRRPGSSAIHSSVSVSQSLQ